MIVDKRKDLRETGNELRDYAFTFGCYSLNNPLCKKAKPSGNRLAILALEVIIVLSIIAIELWVK